MLSVVSSPSGDAGAARGRATGLAFPRSTESRSLADIGYRLSEHGRGVAVDEPFEGERLGLGGKDARFLPGAVEGVTDTDLGTGFANCINSLAENAVVRNFDQRLRRLRRCAPCGDCQHNGARECEEPPPYETLTSAQIHREPPCRLGGQLWPPAEIVERQHMLLERRCCDVLRL